ncbi:MAG: hypothetical protein KA159_05810 [Halioglobus sp.]|nr:hypothetical protein [Halioglobus sp.]
MRVILHIGTDKTGSTSIQNTVFLNREWLLAHSIYVPETGLGEGNGHAGLLRQMEAGALAQLAAELLAASRAGYAQALLSWEGMSSFWFRKKQIRRLGRALGGFQVHVLVYLREQAEIIQSGHLQLVKRNMNRLDIAAMEYPRTLRERVRAMATLRNPKRNYYRLLRPWERCIPGATFSVRIYNRAQLHGGDVVSDFLDQLKVRRDENFTEARENYNQSLDVEGALLLETLKKLPVWKDRIIALIDVTQSVIGVEGQATRYFLSENAVASIRRHYRRSNYRLARHFMGNDAYPFEVLSPCWRSESLAAIETRASQRRQKVEQLMLTPTLMGAARGKDLASMVDLAMGWSTVRDWGVWSTGSESRIRFRLFRHWLIQEIDAVRLVIEGRYYGTNTRTSVRINAVDVGEQDLTAGNCDIVIPVGALYPHEVIEITLGHHAPVSPAVFEGTTDQRLLAFGVERLAYVLIKRHRTSPQVLL